MNQWIKTRNNYMKNNLFNLLISQIVYSVTAYQLLAQN